MKNTRTELLDALKKIQRECEKHVICDGCPFLVREECGIRYKAPCNWKLTKKEPTWHAFQ